MLWIKNGKVISGLNLNAELNPICHLLALLGGATIVVVSRLRVKYREMKTYEEVAVNLQAFLAFRDPRLLRRCG